MSYFNKDRYLLLKQKLVALQASRLQGVLVSNKKEIKQDDLVYSICRDLENLMKDFTVPHVLLDDVDVHFDLSKLECMIKSYLVQASAGDVGRVSSERLNDLIFEYPVFNKLEEELQSNVELKSKFSRSREKAGELIIITSELVTAIRRFTEDNKPLPLHVVVILINFLELTDWFFAHMNDQYRVVQVDVKSD